MEFLKQKYQVVLLLFLSTIFLTCKKSNERKCFKSNGEITEVEIPFNNVDNFKLFKNLKYTIYQDSLNKIVVRGGKNVVEFVDVTITNDELNISNNNSCNFFRNSKDIIEVEIHGSDFHSFYIEPSDSVIFKNKILGDTLIIEVREGGGSLIVDVDQIFLSINVSYGTGDYVLTGNADNAEVKIQNNGYADASAFQSTNLFGYNNSTGNLKLNINNTNAFLLLEGTGNILYTGDTIITNFVNEGSGNFIKF